MPVGIGTKTIMGSKKETTFRTKVAVIEKLPIYSEGIEFDYTDVMHEYLYGGAGSQGSQRVMESVTGSVEMTVPYTVKSGSNFVSASLPIALGMGASAYSDGGNQITFADDLNVFGTFAWDKGHHASSVWQATSCYVNSFTLACNAGEAMTLSCDLIAYDLAINATTNSVSGLAALPTDAGDLVLFSDFVFQIGDQAGALGTGDQESINSFTISVNNNLSDSEQTTPEGDHTDSKKTIQPVRNGFREVTLEIGLPRYSSDTFVDFLNNQTKLQATLLATQPSSSEEFDIIFPNLKVESVSAPVGGSGVIAQTVTMRALVRNSASDVTFSGGSATDAGEMWIETDDGRTASIL
jgi:hypothetical protein